MAVFTIDVMGGRENKISLTHLVDALQGWNMVGILKPSVEHCHNHSLSAEPSLMQGIKMNLLQLLTGGITIALQLVKLLCASRTFEGPQGIRNVNKFGLTDKR